MQASVGVRYQCMCCSRNSSESADLRGWERPADEPVLGSAICTRCATPNELRLSVSSFQEDLSPNTPRVGSACLRCGGDLTEQGRWICSRCLSPDVMTELVAMMRHLR